MVLFPAIKERNTVANRRPHLREALEAVLIIAALAGLAACAGSGRPGHGDRPNREGQVAAPLLYSPNGEALTGGPLGQPSCQLAMEYWLDRADTNHDGGLDRDEFIADARAQFARMDADKLGYLTSDALERYREPYRQSGRVVQSSGTDPVMSADTNFDMKVTQEEFLKQAGETFSRLDANHNGTLAKDELPPLCAQQAGRRTEQHQGPQQGGGGTQRHGKGGGAPRGGSF